MYTIIISLTELKSIPHKSGTENENKKSNTKLLVKLRFVRIQQNRSNTCCNFLYTTVYVSMSGYYLTLQKISSTCTFNTEATINKQWRSLNVESQFEETSCGLLRICLAFSLILSGPFELDSYCKAF